MSFPGVYTGALYSDRGLQRTGFLGEGESGRKVVVVKAHLVRTC